VASAHCGAARRKHANGKKKKEKEAERKLLRRLLTQIIPAGAGNSQTALHRQRECATGETGDKMLSESATFATAAGQ
jgi:hypothetical protein